ncbi:MAG: hypothetical protein WBF14_06145 [Candidatus Acidiferrales bacterium]
MWRSIQSARFPAAALLLLWVTCVLAPWPSHAQGIQKVTHAEARIFPEVGTGVSAIKRDAAGHYYVLARPATSILVLSADGKLIGRIPSPNSANAKIVYAEDFDLDSTGRVLVADRGANAVEIFLPNGSLVAKIPVFAPTSIVALSGGQFAVCSLRPKHLVEIRDQRGALVRSFGDLSDAGVDTSADADSNLDSRPASDATALMNIGRVSGDSAGNIYFAFTSLPDPTLRKYDRFGYSSAEASVPASEFVQYQHYAPDDRVQVGVSFMQMNMSDQMTGWTMIGNTGDVQFGGGMGTGFAGRMGGGPVSGQSAMEGLLSTGMAGGSMGDSSGGASGGPGGMRGGSVSGQGSYQAGTLDFHLGLGLGRAHGNVGDKSKSGSGAKNGSSSSSSTSSSDSDALNAALQFSSQDLSNGDSSDDSDLPGLEEWNTSDSSASSSNTNLSMNGASGSGMRGGHMGGMGMMGGGFGMGFGQGALLGGGFGLAGGTFLPGGFGGGFYNRGISQNGQSASAAGTPITPAPAAGGATGHPSGGAGPEMHDHFGPHGRYGLGMYNITGIVKVNLDHHGAPDLDKPVITAVGVEPGTQEIWTAVGTSLVHFDRSGSYLGSYYISTPDGAPLDISAVLVEPNRILIGTDMRGIFELARPDKNPAAASANPRTAVQAQPVTPAGTKPSSAPQQQ